MDIEQWMSQVGLSGVGEGHALLRCVRELFDNALIACSSQASDQVRIDVAVTEVAPFLFRIRVGDDGCGFGDELCVQSPFSAPGVGYKALLLLAAQASLVPASQQGVFIRTTGKQSQHVTLLQLLLLPSLEVEVDVEHRPKPPGVMFGGSMVSVLVPGPSSLEATFLLRDFFQSVLGLCIDSLLNLTCTLPDGTRSELSVPPTSMQALYSSPATDGLLLPGMEAFLCERMAASFVDTSAELHGVGQGGAVVDASSTVHATVVISTTPTVNHGSRTRPLLQTLVLLNNRTVTYPHSPGEPHPRCATAVALHKVHWPRVGLMMEASSTRLSATTSCSGVWLGIHFRSEEFRFGDMTRSWVSGNKAIVRALSKAIDTAIDEAESALAARGAALSKVHIREMESSENAKHIAHALANVSGLRIVRIASDHA